MKTINPFDRQREVLIAFNGDKDLVLRKQDIIDQAGLKYYHNTDVHAGAVLSRMVNNGLLVRVKRGSYRLGSQNKTPQEPVDPDQTNLFEKHS